jgi:hypothetical protein
MNDLLAQAIAAHGGLDRWNNFHKITTTIVGGGGLWPMKGADLDPSPREMTVMLHEEWASVSPFGQPDWHTVFTPDRVAIETAAGAVVQERSDPRASFTGHVMNTRWDPLHLAYFNGYAMWTYLTTPFFMAMPGFTVAEIPPWQEGSELWRGLRVRFQTKSLATAKSRTSTSATISCFAGTTTTLMWRVALLQRNMSTTLWRWRVSAIQPSALRTSVDQI